jgi:exopolysaccharide production protein ExoZ
MDKKLSWIQVLRGLAALMVVLFHARPNFDTSLLLKPYSHFFDFYFSGVDVFFVLSGFVVYRSSIRAPSVSKFLWDRFSKIYLGYWPVFFIFAGLPLIFGGLGNVPLSKVVESFFLLNPNIWQNLIPTAWSLTFELFFYMWVAIGMFFFRNSIRYYLALFFVLSLWNFFFRQFL